MLKYLALSLASLLIWLYAVEFVLDRW